MSQKTLNTFFKTRKSTNVVNRKKSQLVSTPGSDVEKSEDKFDFVKPSVVLSSPRKRTLPEVESKDVSSTKSDYVAKEEPIKGVTDFIEKNEETLGASPRKNRCNEITAPIKSCASPKKLSSIIPSKNNLSSPKPLSPKSTLKTPEKLSPADVKKTLGSTGSLATLQARLKSLSGSTTPKAKKALFLEETDRVSRSTPASPRLTKKGLNFEVPISKPRAIPQSPVKASPRKQALDAAENVTDKSKNLLQPSDILPLPNSYVELAEIFKTLDGLIRIKFDRSQAISLSAIKEDGTRALSKSVKNVHFEQIRCVFPNAYKVTWERKKDGLGKDTDDYELYIAPHINQLTRTMWLERQKLFKHYLLTIVQDHHQEFLKAQGLDGLDNDQIHRWHKDFDVNKHCPDIDTVEFPAKPNVATPERNPKAMLDKIKGLNASVEKALHKVVEITTPSKTEPMTPVSKAVEDDIKINDKLLGLSPQIIAKIKAKEKERRIKEMTTNKAEQKEIEVLEELLHKRLFSCFINCHNKLRKGKAVPYDQLTSRAADSSGKSKNEVIELLKVFMEICKDGKTQKPVLTVKTYNKVNQVLGNYDKMAPNFDEMENQLKDALSKKK